MSVVAVIPARMGSTRLPGKPLADIGGRPMVVRVLERVRLARRPARILVATDDERIAAVVRAAGGEAVLTSAEHRSGSDRVHEAVARLPCEVVVNVQGDEPFVDPLLIDRLVDAVLAPGVEVATAAGPPADPVAPPSVVRVLVGADGRALAFARRHLRGGRCLRHVGLYAYRRAALAAFVALAPTDGERRERLEQLRLLENGYRIAVVETDEVTLSIDTPADLEAARARAALTAGGVAS
jgi:3-deoxy-manno-octulosonate cytidylyltransferase (CMP-KDO synthetase)